VKKEKESEIQVSLEKKTFFLSLLPKTTLFEEYFIARFKLSFKLKTS